MYWPRGTVLNFATVLGGGLLGWAFGEALDDRFRTVALSGLGLITVVLGIKMALGSQNVLIVAASIALGGMLGLALGIHAGFSQLAETIKSALNLGDDAGFVDVVISTSVLYCIGPMTLLGCMQDRLVNKIDLLALKSTLDGIVAIFFGAVSGPAMVVTAVVVLVVQSAITYAAQVLKPVAEDEAMLAEATGTGGLMLFGTGLSLLALKDLTVANYLPALFLAPALVAVVRRFQKPDSA